MHGVSPTPAAAGRGFGIVLALLDVFTSNRSTIPSRCPTYIHPTRGYLGTPPGHIPHSFVSDYISRAAIPVLSVGMSTSKVVRKLEGFTSKMTVKDELRTAQVIEHYEPEIDFDGLLACARVPPEAT